MNTDSSLLSSSAPTSALVTLADLDTPKNYSKSAEEMGLRHCSNGFTGWIEITVNGETHPVRTPAWLLGLLAQAEVRGANNARARIRAALGLSNETSLHRDLDIEAEENSTRT